MTVVTFLLLSEVPPLFFRRLRIALSVLLGSVLVVGTQTVPAHADTLVTLPLKVNFQTETGAAVPGYIKDFGQAYNATVGYGWTNTVGTPTSLVGNGRQRNVNPDKRLDTLMHMQLPAGSAGVTTVGMWKAAVPNGTYVVTVAAGDSSSTNSHHVINVEGENAIDFTSSDSVRHSTQSVEVTVADGFLNIDATGGSNTKINYLTARAVNPAVPHVTEVDPHEDVVGAPLSTSVTVQLSDGVDSDTFSGMKLVGPGNAVVAGYHNTDGANSNVTFVPSSNLAPNTQYTIQITSSLHSEAGVAYEPYSASFTTGTEAASPCEGCFTSSTFSNVSGVTVMTTGPGNALYAGTYEGSIWKFALGSDGLPSGTPVELTTFKNTRTITGLRFDPNATAVNPKLWVSHGEFCTQSCANFTGKISVLTGANLTTSRDVVVGLPRAVKDHMNNGIEFGVDGKLYLAQGSLSGYGAPDAVWGNRAETPLAATILQMDVNGDSAFAGTVNVNTSSPTNYNPATGPVKLFTEGIRNPFSLLQHSNGKLYGITNESASGNAPAGGGAPALNNLPAYNDYFTQIVPNKYYGHPNPSRGLYILNGGNPTSSADPFEVSQYPVGQQPNANWRKPDLDLGLHRSANGLVEYKSTAVPQLTGQVLATEYSQGKDLIAIKLDASGNAIGKSLVAKGFYNPLGLTADQSTGRVYIAEYGSDPEGLNGKITMLTPSGGVIEPPEEDEVHVNFELDTTTTPNGYQSDFGQAFDEDRAYGWLNATTGAPTSLVGNARERNLNTDKRLDTFMHMQLPANVSGVHVNGKWEATLPNGTYSVTIAVGDSGFTNSTHVVNVEGQPFITAFTPTSGNLHKTFTAPVTVNDGRLTIDATGGTNTKINYVDAVPTIANAGPSIDIAPSGPTNGSGQFTGPVSVAINATDADGVASVSYTIDGGASQTYSAPFTVSAVGNHTIVATATDTLGATGGPVTETFEIVTPPPFTSAKINFGSQTATAVANYTLDYGQAFDAARGYGWEHQDTGVPLSLVGNGRERNVANLDKRLDTLMQFQMSATSGGISTPGKWEYTLPNDTYNVTIAVGDPGFTNSTHVINVEGQPFIPAFTPTTSTKHKTVTASVVVTDGKLTVDGIGGTNTKINYIDIVKPGTDVTPPVVTLSNSGTTNAAGSYVGTTSLTVNATDGGSGVASRSYTVNGGAAQNYTAPVVFNTPGTYTVAATATDNAGNVSNPVSKTFDVVATGGGAPSALEVITPHEFLGLGDRVVFSTVKNEARPGTVITLKNNGAGTLNVTNLTFGGANSGDFKLATGTATSFSLTTGQTKDITVLYRPNTTNFNMNSKVSVGSLNIASNDSTAPTYAVTLGGVNAENYEGRTEPDLQELVNALGYKVNVGVTDWPKELGIGPGNAASSVDEVISAYWKKLDTSKPVSMHPLAHYSGKKLDGSNYTTFGWYNKTANHSAGMNTLYGFLGSTATGGINNGYGENQLLFPKTTSSTRTFNPAASFGFVDGQGNRSADVINGGTGDWHNVRFWQAKDAAGNVIPGTYIVGDDIGSPQRNGAKNWDYQDYAFLLTNVQPDGSNDQPADPAPVPSLPTLEFNGDQAGIANSGFTRSEGATNLAKISVTGGQLRVNTSNDSNTNHTNMLNLPFNAGTDFQIESRLVGPFDAINGGAEQQAIYFGHDATHYLKAEVENVSGVRKLTIYRYNGNGGTVVGQVNLPGNNANTLDLRIRVVPSEFSIKDAQGNVIRQVLPYALVDYRVNSSDANAWVRINPTAGTTLDENNVNQILIPDDWVRSKTYAGIITSHQGFGGAEFTAVYENFSVKRWFR